jgi:2-polyprenyl-3-methyl-5-hydroxy-6-metoxy-1,4-benzoquinol methylase
MPTRTTSFGGVGKLSILDKFGTWLSRRKFLSIELNFRSAHVADVGCGFDAVFGKQLSLIARQVDLFDVSINLELEEIENCELFLGDAIVNLNQSSTKYDCIFCISVLEHITDDDYALKIFYERIVEGGLLVLNIPTWFGKRFLEFTAFKMHLTPATEMNDHKRYYDPRDIWPKLVSAGFLPQDIKCRRHKFGMNTYAICRKRNPAD